MRQRSRRDDQAPYLQSRITLAAVPTAVSCSRWFVKLMFQHWGLDGPADTAELVASELVTNAVKVTGVADPTVEPTDLRGVSLVRVQVTASNGSVFVAVWDCDPNPPVIQDCDLDAEGGRGLWLVSALSRRWSWYPSPKGGKVVWCQIGPTPPVTAAGLPRRSWPRCAPGPRPAEVLPEVLRDRTTLLRVRDGLLSLAAASRPIASRVPTGASC